MKIRKPTLPFPLPAPFSVTPLFPRTLQQLEISGAGAGCALLPHQQPDLSTLAALSSPSQRFNTEPNISQSPLFFFFSFFLFFFFFPCRGAGPLSAAVQA